MALGDRIAVMRAGRLEQIGTGQELYERPVNLFVAFFIGTPSINVFDVTLDWDGAELVARHPAFAWPVPPERRARLAPYAGRPVKVGVRPEDLHVPRLAPFPVSPANQLTGVVNVVEPSATGCAVYLSTTAEAPQDFVATLRTRMPASYLGREVPLAVNLARIHFFDAVSEQTLTGASDAVL